MATGMVPSWWAELDLGRKRLAAREAPAESRSEQYRRYARACLDMAGEATELRIQAVLVHMADVWLRFADEHARRMTNDQNKAKRGAAQPGERS